VQASDVLASLEPLMYGGTTLCEATTNATHIFASRPQAKVLMLVCDGEPTDGNPTWPHIQQTATVLSYLLAPATIPSPHQGLYDDGRSKPCEKGHTNTGPPKRRADGGGREGDLVAWCFPIAVKKCLRLGRGEYGFSSCS
jgi:hypothetical protein